MALEIECSPLPQGDPEDVEERATAHSPEEALQAMEQMKPPVWVEGHLVCNEHDLLREVNGRDEVVLTKTIPS